MRKFENRSSKLIDNPKVMNLSYSIEEMSPTPYDAEEAMPLIKYQMLYPEIFYKLQPFIMMVCDQMEYSSVMPNMEMVQQMTDGIYDDVSQMYPDLVEYMRSNDQMANDDPPENRGFDRDRRFGNRFRRRGSFRDLIDILLLQELFRRRRRFF